MSKMPATYMHRILTQNALRRQYMRKPGLEPGSLAAPDPKAHSSVFAGAPKASSVALELPMPGKVAEAQSAMEIVPAVNDSTTQGATGEFFLERAERRARTVDDFKRAKKRRECEACRWRPPKGLALLEGPDPVDLLLHAHHALPIACGGEDADSNLVLLCPRCHAIAHRLGRMGNSIGASSVREWIGPRTRTHLLHELHLLRDERQWAAYVERGRLLLTPGERNFTLDHGDPVIADALALRT